MASDQKSDSSAVVDIRELDDAAFAEAVRERYQEQGGLTAVFAIGKTRTTYVLEKGRNTSDPGKIEDFADYGSYMGNCYRQLVKNYFDLGGQNLIVTAFSFLGLTNRGGEYAALAAREILRLVEPEFEEFYQANHIDNFFVGVDTYLRTPPNTVFHEVGERLGNYRQGRTETPGNRKLIWEIASIPLYTFWNVHKNLSAEAAAAVDQQLEAAGDDLNAVQAIMYRTFSRAIYGTDFPMPHFYLGCSYSGDFKWRSPMPIQLSGGEGLRLLYTPYPTLFTTQPAMRSIVGEVAFKERWHSAKTDYSGRYSSDLVQAEYDRVIKLSNDPTTVQGRVRKVGD